jgi:hypothetical protein
MTLVETVLRKVAEWRPPEAGRHILGIADEGSGWTLGLTADRCDSVGCLLSEATFRAAGETRAAASLDDWAQRTARQVTALLDSLKVVEVDRPRGEALLRSEQPSQRDGQVLYFEVLLQGTTAATVRRFQGSHQAGQHREQVPFALTHEALAKFTAELTDA